MERVAAAELTTDEQFEKFLDDLIDASDELERNVVSLQGNLPKLQPNILQELIESYLVDAENLIYNFCLFKKVLAEEYKNLWFLQVDEIRVEANFKILTLLKINLPVIKEDMKGLAEPEEKEESGDDNNE